METSPRISTLPPAFKSQDFEFLREQGISEIQALAAKTWTDHNLHDPGITLLEAICYAFTETGLRAGMDIKDLIASSGAYRSPEFFTAAQVLPSAPITLSDFRKLLISHALISNAWLFPFTTAPLGRHSVLLEFADDTLNNNSFVITAVPPLLSDPYIVEVAFPHWNDEEIAPFQQEVVILSVAFDGPVGDEWNNIIGGQSYVARALITYQPPLGGPQVMEIWVVANIVSEMNDAVADAPLILQEVLNEISTLILPPPDVPILVQLNARVTAAYESMRIIRRYVSQYRNLGESFVEFNAVRLQEVAVNATIEVGSGVNIEELLAEIYYRVYRLISPAILFESMEEQLETLKTADAVFDGPLTDSGFLSGKSLSDQQIIETIYTSDILRIIYQLRNVENTDVARREDINTRRIISVRNLKLSNYLDNRPIATGARDCLRLVNSKNHVPRLSVTKSRIAIYRNGIKVNYDGELVASLFNEKLASDAQAVVSAVLDLPVPKGDVYPVKDFYPIQNDLPVVYGVGEAGLPDHAVTARRAQANQLKGYLFFFEQMLAGSQAQLAEFNTFFCANPDTNQTLFQQDIYQVPNIAPLFKGYNLNALDPITAWDDFQNDESNAYRKVLNTGVETRKQFLERRNSILDHLLAGLGEDMQDRAALLFRLATQLPEGVSFPTIADLLAFQEQQRQSALQELIYDKSAYYYDVPELNRDKAQAYGNPLWHNEKIIEFKKVVSGFEWVIKDQDGNPLFKQFSISSSTLEGSRMAEQVMGLATEPGRYAIRIDGTDRILEIRTSAEAMPLAESVSVFASDLLAQAAITTMVQVMKDIWVAHALIPYECRLQHLLGVNVRERRKIAHNYQDYVEIYDEVDVDPFIEKRFRLWSEAGFAGDVLLESVLNYPGPTDPIAIDEAEEGVQLMLKYGIEISNYKIVSTAPNAYQIALMLPDGTELARSLPGLLTSENEAKAALLRIWLHVYRLLSGEGFYILENHLLFPPATTNPDLAIPDQDDPYSFQLTVVLPSGFARNFLGSDPAPAQPLLYRSEEFKKYAEQQIRKYCPAHILPRIIWADRATGAVIDPAAPSFDAFENAYLAWLANYLTDEVDEAVIGPTRDALTTIVNTLYQEYYLN